MTSHKSYLMLQRLGLLLFFSLTHNFWTQPKFSRVLPSGQKRLFIPQVIEKLLWLLRSQLMDVCVHLRKYLFQLDMIQFPLFIFADAVPDSRVTSLQIYTMTLFLEISSLILPSVSVALIPLQGCGNPFPEGCNPAGFSVLPSRKWEAGSQMKDCPPGRSYNWMGF